SVRPLAFGAGGAALRGCRLLGVKKPIAQKSAPDLLANSGAARLAGSAHAAARLAQALDEQAELRALPRAVDSLESDENAARFQRSSQFIAVFGYQLSVISFQLSAFSYQFKLTSVLMLIGWNQ